jgi:hypothetical protein
MAPLVTPPDPALLREFEANPFGPHSLALADLLTAFRMRDRDSPWAIVRLDDQAGFALARIPAERYAAPKIIAGEVFRTPADAEIALFCKRWARHYGDAS